MERLKAPYLRSILLIWLCCLQMPLMAQQRTEYVASEPYQEYHLFLGQYRYKALEISLNGSVMSVTQTEIPVSLVKHDKTTDSLFSNQQCWWFLQNGHLIRGFINKIYLKDPVAYDVNSDSTLSKNDYEVTELLDLFGFDAAGKLGQVMHRGLDISFHHNKNSQLEEVRKYYRDADVMSVEVITLNSEGKPVRMVENYYAEELKHRLCPSDLGPSGIKQQDSVVDTYCYDERGNLLAHQINNRKTNYYVYDSLNNLIFEGRCHVYRSEGNSCKCATFSANQGYEYDNRHRLIREYSIGEWTPSGWDTYYQYDSAGREIDYKHYGIRGEERTFDLHIRTTYNPAGKMVKKEALIGEFRVDEALYEAFFKYPMVVMEEWAYDEFGNIVEHVVYQTKDKPLQIVRYQYRYDPQGNWIRRLRFVGESEETMTLTEILEREIEYYE